MGSRVFNVTIICFNKKAGVHMTGKTGRYDWKWLTRKGGRVRIIVEACEYFKDSGEKLKGIKREREKERDQRDADNLS